MTVIAIKTADLTQNFKQIADNIFNGGERVLISRPRNENLVLITEHEYNELEKARRNAEYLAKLEISMAQAQRGEVVMYTKEQMRAMVEE